MVRSVRGRQAHLLLALADAGLFTAPPELLELRNRLNRLATMTPEPVPPLADVRRDFVSRLTGGEQLTPAGMSARIGTVRAAEQARQDATELIGQAEVQVDGLLTSAVTDLAPDICHELNTALQKVRPAFREAASDFAPFLTLPDDALLATEDSVRKAALKVDALGERVARLFEARDVLAHHFGERAEVDVEGLCYSWSNPIEVWGGVVALRQRRLTAERPWPKEPRRSYFCWLAAGVGGPAPPELWIPSAEQQDERWREVFTDDIRQALAGGLRVPSIAGNGMHRG